MGNALSELLILPKLEKQGKGLEYTPQEIGQQPATWRRTLDRLSSMRGQIVAFLEKCGISANSVDRPIVLLVGAGTSDYIGRALSRVFRQHWKCDVAAVPSTELLTNIEDYLFADRRYLLISFSRSGDSSEGVAVLEMVMDRYPNQARHLVVTCNAAGAMAKLPGVMAVVLDDEVNDRGLAMTSSFTNMVVAGQYLASIETPDCYEALLEEMIGMGSRLLPEAADLAAELARRNFLRMCFVGSGSLQAVAKESSLKVLELNAGTIATVAESALGLRHGPLSFLNDETLVVAYLSSNEERLSYELDLLEELKGKKLGAEIVMVAPRITKRMANISGRQLLLKASESFPDAYRPPVDVIFGQLLGLFTCLANNGTPDTPSSGAISRVVSHVKIYPAFARSIAAR